MSTRADSAAALAAGPMPDLSFAVEDAGAVDHAAVPTLSFRLRIESAGGGGFGNPRERDHELVRRDVRDGLVSRDEAEQAYGVPPAAGG